MISISTFKSMIITFFLFMIIYFPPFCKIPTVYVLGFFSWFYLTANRDNVRKYFNMRKIIIFCLVYVCFIIYIFFAGLFNQGTIQSTVGGWIYLMIFIFPSIIAVALMFIKNQCKLDIIVKNIIYVGALQSIISITSYFIPVIWNIFLKLLSNTMKQEVILFWSERNRLYGWSNTLTYSMGIAQGVIGIIALIYALKKNYKFLVFVPFIWISGIFNTRTTFVIIFIGIFFVLYILDLFKAQNLVKLFSVCILFSVLGIIVFNLRHLNNGWILDGITEIMSLFTGNKMGYFTYLDIENNPEAFMLPSGWQLYFGSGIMGTKSDIGYVFDIWAGGLLYAIVIYMFYVILLIDIYKNMKKIYQSKKMCCGVVSFLGTVLFITNIKGYIFGLNEFMNIFLLIYAIYALTKDDAKVLMRGE